MSWSAETGTSLVASDKKRLPPRHHHAARSRLEDGKLLEEHHGHEEQVHVAAVEALDQVPDDVVAPHLALDVDVLCQVQQQVEGVVEEPVLLLNDAAGARRGTAAVNSSARAMGRPGDLLRGAWMQALLGLTRTSGAAARARTCWRPLAQAASPRPCAPRRRAPRRRLAPSARRHRGGLPRRKQVPASKDSATERRQKYVCKTKRGRCFTRSEASLHGSPPQPRASSPDR